MSCDGLHFVVQSERWKSPAPSPTSRRSGRAWRPCSASAVFPAAPRSPAGSRRIGQRHHPSRQRAAPGDAGRRRALRHDLDRVSRCCSLAVNYGAIVLWLARHWSVPFARRVEDRRHDDPAVDRRGRTLHRGVRRARRTRTAARHVVSLLRTRVDRVARDGAARRSAGSPRSLPRAAPHCCSRPANNALAWWVMPATFGIGQIVIGALVARDAWESAR